MMLIIVIFIFICLVSVVFIFANNKVKGGSIIPTLKDSNIEKKILDQLKTIKYIIEKKFETFEFISDRSLVLDTINNLIIEY